MLCSLFNLSISIGTQLRLIPALKNDWTGRVSCALLSPLQGFFTYCSWFSIAVIAVDRFCAVSTALYHVTARHQNLFGGDVARAHIPGFYKPTFLCHETYPDLRPILVLRNLGTVV